MASAGPSTRQSTPTIQPEPSDQWKAALRLRIQRNLAPMVKEAEENLAKELNGGPIDDARRQALSDTHAKSMNNIRRMAQDTYNTELERERQERRWMGGETVEGEWRDVLAKQQQAIMDEIKEKTARSRSNTLEEHKDGSGSGPHPPPLMRPGPPQAPPHPVAIPQPVKNAPVTISPSDSFKGGTGAGPARRPSNMSDTHPRPFRDGPPRPDLDTAPTILPMNSSYAPPDAFAGASVNRRPSHMSDQRPIIFRPRGDSVGVGEDHIARWVPSEPPPADPSQMGSGRPRQGSAGSNRSLGDGSLDRWMPHPNPEESIPLSRKPTTMEKPTANGRSVTAQGWRPALPSDDRLASSRTFDIAKGDGYETTDTTAGTGDENDALTQEWSRVSKGRPRRHDRAKQRTGPSSPSLLDPPRPAPSQQVSLVEVRRTSSSPILDTVELPVARPIPTRRPSARIRSRSPLGAYPDSSDRGPPNGGPAGFQAFVAPEKRHAIMPHPLLTRSQPVNQFVPGHVYTGPPPPSIPPESNIASSRPLVRRRSFSAGESPMNSPPDERDWYHVPRESPIPMEDTRHELPQRSPWGVQPTPVSAHVPTSASPHSPHWWGPEPPPNSALSGKLRRGSQTSLFTPADDARGSVSPAAGPSSSRPINLAKKRSINLREDADGPGGSASSPRSRAWFGPAIPEDGRLEDFQASSPTYRDDIPPPPPPPARAPGASSRPSSLRSRGSHDMRPSAHEVFIVSRRRSNNHEDGLSDDGSEDEYGFDRRSVRSLELEEAMRREREATRREEDARKKEDDARRKEEEAMRKEEEARKEKEEARRREEDARRREEENRKKEEEVRKEREDLRKREEDVKRREDKFQLQVEEARKKEVELKRKEEEARAQVVEVRRKEQEVKLKEEEARRMRDEATRKEEEARRKEDEAKRIREEARKQQQDSHRQIDEAKREAKRKLEDAVREAKRNEEDARRQLDDAKREAKRREEDFQRREQELTRWEEELARRQALQQREKELMEREELVRQREEMQRRKDALERERLEDEEARRLEEELRQQELEDEEEERLRQEELLREHEEQLLEEDDFRRQQEEEEEDARLLKLQLAEEAAEEERLEELRQEERRREALRIVQEEDDKRRRKEEEARRAELFRKKQADEQVRQDEELARRLAQEEGKVAAQRKAQQAQQRKQELEMHKQQAEQSRKEEEARRKAQEEERLHRNKQAEDDFYRFEEEFRRRSGDRGRYDSTGSAASASASTAAATATAASVPRPIPSRTPQPPNGIPIPGDRTSTGSSNWSGPGSSASAWSASTRATSATSASTARPMNFPNPGTTPPSAPPPRPSAPPNIPNVAPTFGASPSSAGRSAPPLSESEWARRQAEQAKKQQEAFRREQERQDREKQTKATRALTREEALNVFTKHDQAWQLVRSAPKLRWDAFPWPVFRKPSSPEDLTTDAVGAYVLSPHHLSESVKSNKDRIKEHIKRWHPDRFETQLLPKVNDEEKEKVKEGAGWVARALNELLTRINSPGFFD